VILSAAGRRYSAVPGEALHDVGAAFGRVVPRDGGFVELVGNVALGITLS
jgi:hypothetical protein